MRKYSFLLTALLFFVGVTAVFGQGRSISGKVVDSESGTPLVGASVEVVNAQTGTSTDENGNFTVTLPEGFTRLKIENTSYETQEVVARDGIVVRLVAMSETLTEVDVEVAMGTKKGKGYVGSAAMVSGETIEKRNPSDVTKALSGEVAGLQVVTSTGQPGTTSTVRLRGAGSLNASSGVLYVVDGIPYGNEISAIDPSDIVSTTVLKDATATSMYGARGADGVILITTKRGTAGAEGKIEVDFSVGTNFRYLPMHEVITNPEEYMELSWLGLYNFTRAIAPQAWSNAQVGNYVNNYFLWDPELGMPVQYNLWNTNNIINPLTGKFNENVSRKYEPESWYDHMFHTGIRTGIGVKLSGGADKTTYYTSVNFLNDEGYYIQSDFKRLTALTNLDYAPKKWLTANFKMQYAYSTMNNVGQSSSAANNGFYFVNAIPPIYPVFQHTADGSLVEDKYLGGNAYDYGQYIGYARPFLPGINPAGALQLDKSFSNAHNLAVSSFLKFEFVKDLVFTITNGYNLYMGSLSTVMNMFYGDGENVGRISYSNVTALDFNTRQQLTYKKTFANVHNFDIMLGHDFRNQETKRVSGQKSEMLKPNDINLSNAIKMVALEGSHADYRSESYLGELRYNFEEKYFAILNGSIYGSSYFAPGHRYGTFASAGASWNIHRELFMSDIKKWISNLKVKASFGTSGNDNIGNYNYLNMYALTNFGGLPAVLWSSIAEPSLTWETTYKFNTGIEFEIKKGLLYGELEFYTNTTVNNLDTRTIASSIGYSSIPINDGVYRNYGIEFMLRAHVIKSKNFDLNLRLTGARHNGIFVELPKELVNGKLVEMVMNGNYGKGMSLGSIYTRTFLGVNPENGWSVWRKYYDANTGKEDPILEPYRYTNDRTVDENGNVVLKYPKANLVPTVTSDSREAAYEYADGKLRYPDLYGGFGIDFSTYGFDVSLAFDYIIGGYAYDAIYNALMGDGAFGTNNYHVDMLKTWSPFQSAEHNQSTQVPILYAGQGVSRSATEVYYADFSNAASTRFLISNTGLRLGSVRVAYNFPKKMLERISLNNLSLWVSGDNLMVLSARKGYNPFTFLNGGNNYSQYAPLTSVMGGIKFSF